jgi:hypothetical protein
MRISRSCKKVYLRDRPHYSCLLPFYREDVTFNQPQATGVYSPPLEDIVEDPIVKQC